MTNTVTYTINPFDIHIECHRDEDGKLYLPIKRVCDLFGLNHRQEKAKIKRRSYLFHPKPIPFLDKLGRHRNMLSIEANMVRIWLCHMSFGELPRELWHELWDHDSHIQDALIGSTQLIYFSGPMLFSEMPAELRENITFLDFMDYVLPSDPNDQSDRKNKLRNKLLTMFQDTMNMDECAATSHFYDLVSLISRNFPREGINSFADAVPIYATVWKAAYLFYQHTVKVGSVTYTKEEASQLMLHYAKLYLRIASSIDQKQPKLMTA